MLKNDWELLRIANGQLSCENSNKKEKDLEVIEEELKKQFNKRLLDEHIVIMWDCWSGVFIMQNAGFDYTNLTEQLLLDIFDYLKQKN